MSNGHRTGAGTATDRDRALQLRILEIEEAAAREYLESMRSLVEEHRDGKGFAEAKTEYAMRWAKKRARSMNRVGYQFDERRRDPDLVRRDVKAELSAMEVRLQAAIARRGIGSK